MLVDCHVDGIESCLDLGGIMVGSGPTAVGGIERKGNRLAAASFGAQPAAFVLRSSKAAGSMDGTPLCGANVSVVMVCRILSRAFKCNTSCCRNLSISA